MYFDNFTALLQMDGHGFYVWTSYALGAAILGWNLFAAMAGRRRFLLDEARRLRRAAAQRGGAA